MQPGLLGLMTAFWMASLQSQSMGRVGVMIGWILGEFPDLMAERPGYGL